MIEQNLKSNQTFLKKRYLSECPDSWIQQKSCILKKIRQPGIRQNPFITLYNDLIKHPIQQMIFFIHNSLDDLVEDFIALGTPVAVGTVSLLFDVRKSHTFFIILFVHTLSSPMGDNAGDWVQQYQQGVDIESEQEGQLCEIIANKIEDSIKATFIIVCYGNTLIIKLLEQCYYPSPTSEANNAGQISKLYNTAMGVLLIIDTCQFFERYNWINEIADAIADMFTEFCRHGN